MFELKRKSIHFLGLSVPILYWFYSREIILLFVGGSVLCAFLIEVARLRSERFNSLVFEIIGGYTREHEQKKVTGATFYAVAALLAVAFFSKMVAISSLLFLTLGDSTASLVGTRFGHHRLYGKSAEGSAACLFVCSTIGWPLLRWIGLIGAVTATITELAPLPVDDNLRIPVVSGVMMQLILYSSEIIH